VPRILGAILGASTSNAAAGIFGATRRRDGRPEPCGAGAAKGNAGDRLPQRPAPDLYVPFVAAKALGLTIPLAILARADEVIE
jgi:hypothetical protein